MKKEDLETYLEELSSRELLDRYVDRRFAALNDSSGSVDIDLQVHRIVRDREPTLEDILKNNSVLVLAEPGGGKSVVARAAVQQFVSHRSRVPVFVELKEYRDDLDLLIGKSAARPILDTSATIDGKPLLRAYVLDGIDEIPRGALAQFGRDLQTLIETDPTASVFVTARQAFYATYRGSLPQLTAIFHILEFSDEDIAAYLAKSKLDSESFLAAVRGADASEEIRNPFVLSVMVDKYRNEGMLSNLRTDNLSYIIDQMIQSRPQVNRYQQHRALRMLGIACETCSRNELTEEEALLVIKQAARKSEAEARVLLDELYNSILKRTSNGLAFQMRSYGEYLAAEELGNVQLDRVKELAFLDYRTPNDSWLNTMSYLVELNPSVRTYFVREHSIWTISASPAAFSDEEKNVIVRNALQDCVKEKQYVYHHPLINVRRLSRFVTDTTAQILIEDLKGPDDLVRGNALAILGLLKRQEALEVALDVVKDKQLGIELRQSAIVALVNLGTSTHVPVLLNGLDSADSHYVNLIDLIGSLADESQLDEILPLIFRENAMLSATYYHFREFKSREALVRTLQYFRAQIQELNVSRAGAYIEPVFELLSSFFDDEIAHLCADMLEQIVAKHLYPDHMGVLRHFIQCIRKADQRGQVARVFFERALKKPSEQRHRTFYVDQMVVTIMTHESAEWLIDNSATDLIRELAPYCDQEMRELLRPHSGGLIDTLEANTKAYREQESSREEARKERIKELQDKLLSRTKLHDALKEFWELKEDYWPELPDAYRSWLAAEIGKELAALDLKNQIYWKGNTLWQPQMLSFLLPLVDRYALKIQPDDSLVFVLSGWDTGVVANYYKRCGLSASAINQLENMLDNQESPRTREEVIRFIASTEIWSKSIEATLQKLVTNPADLGNAQANAFSVAVKHNLDVGLVATIVEKSSNVELKRQAFEYLVQLGHRATIEGSLSRLSDDNLKTANARFPGTSDLGWLVRVKADFAWDKLADLRKRALQLEIPNVVGLITNVLAGIDRTKTAVVLRKQVNDAPAGWRTVQVAQAIEQERLARIEAARQTPFEKILLKLRGTTSIARLKVLCEGSTDEPVFKALIGQIVDPSNIVFDSVGGWPNLRAKADPNIWLLGCKEAVIVMDGDQGRRLAKRGKPLTDIAKEEKRKFSGLPIELKVLERYGIENYFPQNIFEKILGVDLSTYFPIPDHVPVSEQLSKSRRSMIFRLRKIAAKMFGFPQPNPKEPLYSKRRNADAAAHLKLEDLRGTDLLGVVNDIKNRATRLSEEW